MRPCLLSEHLLVRYSRSLSNQLRTLGPGESFIAEHLTAKKTAEVIITALKYAVAGYEHVGKELEDPTMAWQSRLTFGDGQNEV